MLWEFQIFKELAAVQTSWEVFEQKAHLYVFQTYAWIEHWYHTLGGELKPCIVTIYGQGQLKALLPLGTIRHKGMLSLVWLGGNVSDYHGPLLSQDFWEVFTSEDFRRLWTRILAHLPRCSLLRLQQQPAQIGSLCNPFITCFSGVPAPPAPWVDLSQESSWESYYAKRRPALKADSQRQRKRLQERGPVAFHVADSLDQKLALMERLFEQKSRRYHEMGVTDLFAHEAYKAFYRGTLTKKINTHISFMQCSDIAIAVHWGVVFQERFYYILPSFAEKPWATLSPGRLLLEELIRNAFDQGVRIFDFTSGGEAYKEDWCAASMSCYSLKAGLTPFGKVYCAFKERVQQPMHESRQYMACNHKKG